MLVLSKAEVEAVLDLDVLIDRLGEAFVELSSGRASVPPRVAAFVPDAGLLAAMPGHVGGTLATKLVSVFEGNHERGLPSHQAVIVLFDAGNGSPLAVMDGTYITAMRTAGASAVATRALARSDASVLAVIGAGVQGRAHLEMIPRVRDFAELRIASRDSARAERLAAEFGARVEPSFEAAVRGADVVSLCTHSATPVIRREWLAPGVHVTSVGANFEGPELDAATVTAGLLAVESRVAFEPPPAGAAELVGLDPREAVELGELVAGSRPGRGSDEEITVYKSMGHAVEDAAAARLAYDGAIRDGAGAEVSV